MIGIYLIKCNSENKVYIGQSKNIKKRYNSHIIKLRKNNHENLYLQDVFNKYGENDFTLEILYEFKDKNIDRQKLYDLEILYISLYNSNNRNFGYNIESGGNSFGRFTKETLKKMSDCKKGKKHSKFTKDLLSKILKGRTSHWKGKKQTKEHSEKRTKQQIGKIWINNGVINKFVTKKESEFFLNQGFKYGRIYFIRNTCKYEYKGKKYSLSEISRICGIDRSVLFYRLKNGWSMDKATSTPIKKWR
jgi:group I intron endonuclease